MPSILALIMVMILVGQAAAGTWTEHQFIYKPSLGARGEIQKNAFDSGLDRVDAHLGKYKTLGDPGYETLAAALTTIGGNSVCLTIPAGAVSIAANTTIPANVHLKVLNGGSLNISDGATLTINGPFEAGPYQVFSWAGTGKVVFGTGAAERVYPEWWGAKADGTTECATAFQKAFDACPNVRLGKGSYKLTDTSVLLNSTTVAMGYTFRGEGMETKLLLYGYTDKYAFHLNADASKNRVIDWPQGPRLVVGDMLVHGGNSTSASFLYARQCCVKVENIRFNYLYKGFYFEDYCDRLTLRDIHWTDPKANGQFFHLRQGDTLTIDGINIYPHNNNGCSINYSGGFRVSNIIGGIHKFEYCQGGTFENCHIEGGEVKIGNSTMTLRNNFFYNRNLPNGYAVLCDGNLGSYWHPHNHIVFENNVFSFVGMAAGDVRGYDIKIINPKGRDVYVFRNNVGNLAAPATEFISEKAGIVVYSDDAKLGPALQKFKGRVSGDLTLAYDDGYLHDWVAVVPGAREVQYSPAPTFDWSGEGVKPSNLPQGTYYYKMAWYNEVGHTTPSSQTQVTTSAPNKSIELTINGRQPDGFLRVWRGPSSGSYDRYVDIPLSGPHISLHDMGSTLSGYAWITSGVPSVPAANTTMHGIITARDKRQFWSSAAPSSAEFTGVVGDIVWKENPAVGQPKGWVCTVAGSPGTWVSLGNL
ncbi:MAG: right-handed parallel beta-helix repeat-containing protein [Deltaproteobacteria bacterium]|nr:right-handed parallel beta-helix repeat-containing protein [Deltaproteobacteria bacterium]